jgi:hypothetical protein
MGLYDYSFNNNYLLFQNPPSNYSNFDYGSSNSSIYHDYNSLSIPNYNHFPPASTPIFGSSFRHSNIPATSTPQSQSQMKSELALNAIPETVPLNKMQTNVHNTSEHVHELNQMCLIKEPKEFEKNSSSEFFFCLF